MLRSICTGLIELIKEHTVAVLPADDQPIADVMGDRYRIHAGLVDAIADRDEDFIRQHSVEHAR